MKPLPFDLEQVESISWTRGHDKCKVLYFDPALRAMRSKKVTIAEMDILQPAFERLLTCAQACSGVGDARHIAFLVKKWSTLLRNRPPAAYIFSNTSILEGSRLPVAAVSSQPNFRQIRHVSRIVFGRSVGDVLDQRILNANFPGIVECLHILCNQDRAVELDEFDVFVKLGEKVPYHILHANAAAIPRVLQSCLATGVPLSEMSDIVAASLEQETEYSFLPDLDMSTS
jgi:hypothetical protein